MNIESKNIEITKNAVKQRKNKGKFVKGTVEGFKLHEWNILQIITDDRQQHMKEF